MILDIEGGQRLFHDIWNFKNIYLLHTYMSLKKDTFSSYLSSVTGVIHYRFEISKDHNFFVIISRQNTGFAEKYNKNNLLN